MTSAATPIRFVQARNFKRVTQPPRSIDVIVIHTMESPESPRTAEDVAAWFAGRDAPQASAHYNIDADSIVQGVLDKDVAWAAPGCNHNGLQFEHAGRASQGKAGWGDPYSLAMLRLSARLAAVKCRQYDIPIGFVTATGLRIGKRGLTGHLQVSEAFHKSDHTDPGPDFPWSLYLTFVREASEARYPAWFAEAEKATPMWAWIKWMDHGRPADLRPRNIRAHIPPLTLAAWRLRYAIHRGKRP